MATSSTSLLALARACLASVLGLTLALLLYQLLFRGWAHSFDTMMYARSLWGIARGDYFNPIADRQALSVHAHVTIMGIAHLTHLLPAALVLILAQSAAFGATVWLVMKACQSHAERLGATPAKALLVAAWAAGIVVLSPLVTNPFLFDARPCLVAVPFCLAGFLRLRRQRAFDRTTVLLLALGVLSREDFALPVAVAAMVVSLDGAKTRVWRVRALGVLVPMAYLAAYFFVGRRFLGGETAVTEASASSVVLDASVNPDFGWYVFGLYKMEILLVFLLTAGALGIRQWRWLLVAAPGLALLLINQRLQAHVLNFHYPMLAAPGLLVAAVAGYEAKALRVCLSRALILRTLAVGLACFVVSGAAPGGGRFRPQNFLFWAPSIRADIAEPFRSGLSKASHRELAQVPRSAGLVVPFSLGAPYVDRELVLHVDQVNRHRGRLDALSHAAFFPRSWSTRGRYLVEHESFRLMAMADSGLAVLRRGRHPVPEAALRHLFAAISCEKPVGQWPEAGLALCGVDDSPGRKVALVLARVSSPSNAVGERILHLWLRADGGAPVELLSLSGMLNPSHLGARGVRYVPKVMVSPGRYDVFLTLEGRPQQATLGADEPGLRQSVPISWPSALR